METSRREIAAVLTVATILALGFSSFNQGTRRRPTGGAATNSSFLIVSRDSGPVTELSSKGGSTASYLKSANNDADKSPPNTGGVIAKSQIDGDTTGSSGGAGVGTTHDDEDHHDDGHGSFAGGGRGKILRIAAVGDSVTEGDRKHLLKSSKKGDKAKGHLRNYPVTLQRMMMGPRGCPILQEKYNTTKFMVRNFGENGKTVGASPFGFETRYNESMRYNKSVQFDPDILLMMFGMNDAKEEAWSGRQQFTKDTLNLLSRYAENHYLHDQVLETWFRQHNDTTAHDRQPHPLSKVEKDLQARIFPRDPLQVLLLEPPPISTKMWDRTAFSVQGDIVETDLREAYQDVHQALQKENPFRLPKALTKSLVSPLPPLRIQTIWNRELNVRVARGEQVLKGYRRHPLVLLHNTKPTQLSMDGVHPSRDGAKLIAFSVYQALCEPRNLSYYQGLEKEAAEELKIAKNRSRLSTSIKLGETYPPGKFKKKDVVEKIDN